MKILKKPTTYLQKLHRKILQKFYQKLPEFLKNALNLSKILQKTYKNLTKILHKSYKNLTKIFQNS